MRPASSCRINCAASYRPAMTVRAGLELWQCPYTCSGHCASAATSRHGRPSPGPADACPRRAGSGVTRPGRCVPCASSASGQPVRLQVGTEKRRGQSCASPRRLRHSKGQSMTESSVAKSRKDNRHSGAAPYPSRHRWAHGAAARLREPTDGSGPHVTEPVDSVRRTRLWPAGTPRPERRRRCGGADRWHVGHKRSRTAERASHSTAAAEPGGETAELAVRGKGEHVAVEPASAVTGKVHRLATPGTHARGVGRKPT